MIKDDDKQLLDQETYYATDSKKIRQSLFDKTLNSIQNSFPIEWGGVRLEINNLKYENKDSPFSLKDQKDYLMKNKYLTKSLKGDIYLYDSKTNNLLDTIKQKTIMHVPYYTERGTFIHNGNEYSTLKQVRLRPGVYSRRKANGELETQFNVQRGTGVGFRVTFTPETGIYKLNVGQSSLNLYSILHDLGVSDDELSKTWGEDILQKNKAKYDYRALSNAASKLVGKRNETGSDRASMIKDLKNAFMRQQIDEDIKIRNLG